MYNTYMENLINSAEITESDEIMYLKLFQERKFNRIRELFKKIYPYIYKQNEDVILNVKNVILFKVK